MFTGLIRHKGILKSRSARSGGARLCIEAPPEVLDHAEVGSSICTNGACLTVVEKNATSFCADLSEETLAKTTLGSLAVGEMLHLEPALRVGDPLDGHLVSGHVDGMGQLLARATGEGLWWFGMPPELALLMAPKGSVTVDGLSLTVVDCTSDRFSVALIPETVASTRLKDMRVGCLVNLEGDPVGRFVARAMALRGSDDKLQAFARKGWA